MIQTYQHTRGSVELRDRGARAGRTLGRIAVGLALAATAACDDRLVAPTDASTPAGNLGAAAAPAMTVVRDPDLFCPFGCDAIAAGDSMRYVVRFTSADGRERHSERAQWASADERIAAVSPNGMVVGRAPGEVEIRATVGQQTATATVTVGIPRIAKVVLSAPSAELEPRRSVQLAAVAIDALGNPVRDPELFWFSATPSVVTVDANGVATATGPGDGIVMVFAGFGRSAWISLHVNGSPRAAALGVAGIDVGGTQSCSASAAGAASCWGWNHYGQLGNGEVAAPDQTFPTPGLVEGGLAFAQVTAGDFHSCGVTSDGAAYCWGDGANGRRGDGATNTIAVRPSRVLSRQGFTAIEAGGDATCALDAQRAAWCWGFNGFGQLGTGTLEDAHLPTRVAGGVAFARILPALWHGCGLATDGTAWCWGANDMGQLGNGKLSLNGVSPTPAKVATRLRFVAMDSRSSHSCGITASGEAHCWGRNDFGQLGDGSFESRARPVRVPATVPFTTVATGGFHSCALAGDGRAWCWGDNAWGQLGDNTLTSRATPAPVHGTPRFVTLTAGNNVTCGATATGEAWCWGSSHFGMLGNGQSGWDTISAVPVRVVARR